MQMHHGGVECLKQPSNYMASLSNLNVLSVSGNSEISVILDPGHLKHYSETAWAHMLLLLQNKN